jgi:hypothetical protein
MRLSIDEKTAFATLPQEVFALDRFRARKRLAHALSGASRPVVNEGRRAPDRSGKTKGQKHDNRVY